ncbi:MAG: hypothetical protein [Namikivirus tsukuho]|uniref:Uncharacterized protein n=1 Tax=Bacteriophage sp. TaxID=38018 RepID=A0ABY5TRT1_9VIRU|nr:MAG: hypothetical protein [Bacteriophage sp.]
MSDIVLHPLTALNGVPAYTADDYRRVVNPFMFPSDGSAFGGVQGVRYGSPGPLSTIDGLTVTVKPHCGTVRPWNETGSYTYAITGPMTVDVPDSLGDYKIVVAVYDPSLSHGETPGAWLQSWDASTPDAKINGLVIARVTAGVVSDVAPKIHVDGTIEVADWNKLIAIWTVNEVEAITSSDGQRYRRVNDAWVSLTDVQLSPGQWADDWSVWYKCSMSGNIVSLMVKVTRVGEWEAKAWEKSQILTFPDYVKPNVIDFNVPAAGVEYSGFQLDKTGLYVRPFRDLTYSNGMWSSATLSWAV